jgi:DNA (cytosine-5)-methyltransferase 1
MIRPVLLDLFCGGGGAGMGYHRAGWDVVGVDIEPQPDYPFTFVQGDALALLPDLVRRYRPALVHASPPCQSSSPMTRANVYADRDAHVNLIPPTRDALRASGLPYVIENVNTRKAALIRPVVLCGTTFGLSVYRHRGFETDLPLVRPAHSPHTLRCAPNSYLPTAARPMMTVTGRNGHHSKAWQAAAAAVMGVEWMTGLNQVCESIPPAYTECVGRQARELLFPTRLVTVELSPTRH